ncbi:MULTISPECIES: hypothetical protein [Pseudoxanthomonas]|uniref:Uncharacterized protein n=1 Tax=Pseudoxanthomonas taiwanensis J19 TaxID=935569 RepID=A0A562DZH3_9GAMM|nr:MULTISPECIES: hypothetical protein [Pseudoxanthomonas]TWH14967.1 hypothetical protein L613_002000000210 [Pseudoxanthomonas taiwanensis J19]
MSGLAFASAPPAARPLRFLLCAPAWGVVAGTLLVADPHLLDGGRWSPPVVALVHVFTLGVLGNAMLGSLLQFLPVAAGTPVRAGRLLPLAHAALNLGLVLFVLALYRWPAVLPAAATLLAASLLPVLAPPLPALLRQGTQRLLRAGIGAALLALAATALLGVVATAVLRGYLMLPLDQVVDAHAMLGGGGWLLGLLAAVGGVTVPMFQGTAQVAPRAQRAWTLAAVVLPLAAAVARLLGMPATVVTLALALQAGVLAAAVLRLQWHAPHRRNPALVRFWCAGCIALCLAAAAACAGAAGAPGLEAPAWAMLAGVLGLGVGAPLLVTGMLLEIVAFIAWVDLRGRCPRGMRIPAVGRLQPEEDKRRVLALHLVAALLLPAAFLGPLATLAAGLALSAAHAATALCLLRCLRRARHFRLHPEAYR